MSKDNIPVRAPAEAPPFVATSPFASSVRLKLPGRIGNRSALHAEALERMNVIIQSVALRTPSRCVSNDEIIENIRKRNSHVPKQEIYKYCDEISQLLRNAGAETRYIRDRQAGEKGFDLLVEAARSAIRDANLAPSEIGLIIFCGVARGFLEPANATFVAKALGVSCDSFDVVDACMGWVRSLQIAQSFLGSRSYSNVLIVNAEFNVYENGLPNILDIRTNGAIAHTFPALTIGEAASATVVSASTNPWKFSFRSVPQHASLCSLPLIGFKEFCDADERIGVNGPHQLTAFGMEMLLVAVREMIDFVNQTYQDKSKVDLWLPHNPGEAGLRLMASELQLGDRLYTGIFRKFGNIVSASIPAAIAMATQEGRLHRGQRIVLCPASAGMAFSLVEGVY
jgi:3-oxoacyl-[acyl-carrier-protein] synthase III